MNHIYIDRLEMDTVDACSLFLVGGFDEEKRHTPAMPLLRPPVSEELRTACLSAEDRDYGSIVYIENVIMQELSEALELTTADTIYHYDIQSFTCSRCLEILRHEVMAQVNDD